MSKWSSFAQGIGLGQQLYDRFENAEMKRDLRKVADEKVAEGQNTADVAANDAIRRANIDDADGPSAPVAAGSDGPTYEVNGNTYADNRAASPDAGLQAVRKQYSYNGKTYDKPLTDTQLDGLRAARMAEVYDRYGKNDVALAMRRDARAAERENRELERERREDEVSARYAELMKDPMRHASAMYNGNQGIYGVGEHAGHTVETKPMDDGTTYVQRRDSAGKIVSADRFSPEQVQAMSSSALRRAQIAELAAVNPGKYLSTAVQMGISEAQLAAAAKQHAASLAEHRADRVERGRQFDKREDREGRQFGLSHDLAVRTQEDNAAYHRGALANQAAGVAVQAKTLKFHMDEAQRMRLKPEEQAELSNIDTKIGAATSAAERGRLLAQRDSFVNAVKRDRGEIPDVRAQLRPRELTPAEMDAEKSINNALEHERKNPVERTNMFGFTTDKWTEQQARIKALEAQRPSARLQAEKQIETIARDHYSLVQQHGPVEGTARTLKELSKQVTNTDDQDKLLMQSGASMRDIAAARKLLREKPAGEKPAGEKPDEGLSGATTRPQYMDDRKAMLAPVAAAMDVAQLPYTLARDNYGGLAASLSNFSGRVRNAVSGNDRFPTNYAAPQVSLTPNYDRTIRQ